MIVSHKHKFIFIKTHKTATQTFLKFIKPHLGPDDVMAGDPPNDRQGDEHVEDTQVNVDKVFPQTGKSALDYKEKYGNHLPWFMIKEIVGDDIWNKYTKFTIERDPYDRILSLFYFQNPTIVKPGILISDDKKQKHIQDKTFPDTLKWMNENSLLSAFPGEVRQYFEDWCLVQLLSTTLKLTDHATYAAEANSKEVELYLSTAKSRPILKRLYETYTAKTKWKNPNNGQEFQSFPYLKDQEIILWKKPFEEGWPFYGQCRFLNYGNYHDGNDLKIDYVVNFKDVGDNLGKFFRTIGSDIKCNKKLYDNAIQNHHYRKNLNIKKDNEWWYSGDKSARIKALIDDKFYSNRYNLDKIFNI